MTRISVRTSYSKNFHLIIITDPIFFFLSFFPMDPRPSRFGPDGPMSTTAVAALSSLVTLLVMFVLLFAYHVCIRSRGSSRREQPYNPLDVSTSAATVRDVKGEPISPLGIPDEGQGYANGRTDKYGEVNLSYTSDCLVLLVLVDFTST